MAERAVTAPEFVHFLTLQVDPTWRRQPPAQREEDLDAFRRVFQRTTGDIRTLTYSMVGLRADADLLLVRFADSLDALETSACLLLRAGVGRSMRVAHSWIGLIRQSQYTKRPTGQEQGLRTGDRAGYLVVYPFTKTHEWYQLSRETRQGMMSEHIRIGHDYPQVRQLLAHSTGLDDQEFIVAYETDDLTVFQDLVVALRETEARRFTLRDSPTLTAISRPLEDVLALLG
ncbi:MAG TPA: chlorite dismutase family protein [bacterium]|nr:chlorite dismutase family protein [bacterium]